MSISELEQLDVAAIREDFPILSRTVRDGRPLVYLDSGATSQKPRRVLDAEREFYERHNAAVHRGAHQLAEEATDAYEMARETIASFIGADTGEVVFTKNATEGINLVAYAMSNAATADEDLRRFQVGPGDEIVVTEMEHHANLVPWQQLCQRTGARLRWVPVTEEGRLDLSEMGELINERTRVVALIHQSNVLGTINPVAEITARAREVGALVVLDACQSVPHMPVDVADLDVDFLTFSGHKMLGPSGIGVLWGRRELLEAMPPFITGGSMIGVVHMEYSTWAEPPQRFEAGVPMAAQAIGLAAACDYLTEVGMDRVAAHEHALTEYALKHVGAVEGVRIVGPTEAVDRGGAVSFVVDDIHPTIWGRSSTTRSGGPGRASLCLAHAPQAGIVASTRASFYLYNTLEDVDALVEAIKAAQTFFGTRGS